MTERRSFLKTILGLAGMLFLGIRAKAASPIASADAYQTVTWTVERQNAKPRIPKPDTSVGVLEGYDIFSKNKCQLPNGGVTYRVKGVYRYRLPAGS